MVLVRKAAGNLGSFPALARRFSVNSNNPSTIANALESKLLGSTKNLTEPSPTLTAWVQSLNTAQMEQLSKGTLQQSSAKRALGTTTREPSQRQLRLVALHNVIPFIGFGIMDNAILIIAGDAIDTSLGVLLGISTMCAAAIGNIVSDVAGILFGTLIEDVATRLNLPNPNITEEQRQLRSVRVANQIGCAIGIVIGTFVQKRCVLSHSSIFDERLYYR